MIEFIVAMALEASISNELGRIGIMIAQNGYIGKVYKTSPAATAGLQKGDIVIDADGKPGIKDIDGTAGINVLLTVKKKDGNIIKLTVPRVSRREIHD